MKAKTLLMFLLLLALRASAQDIRLYDEQIDPIQQIDQAVLKAAASGRNIICQVGGNWCPWCIRLAKYVKENEEISKAISEDFEYIHVNWPSRGASQQLSERLNNPGRFGFPVLVVLSPTGEVLHIQDTALLEEGQGYDPQKVLRFLSLWTPKAVNGEPKH